MASREYLEQQFAAMVDPQSVAAIIMELELGEGGFVPAPKEFVKTSRLSPRITGSCSSPTRSRPASGAPGKMFACEHYGLVPDLMTTAKSLAGGLPLAAVTGRADVLDSAQPGGLGGTYGGNPLACAAALAVLDAMGEDHLTERGAKVGERIRARFEKWAQRFPQVGDVRGLGGMMASSW